MAFVAWFLGQMNQWKYLAYGIQLPVPLIVVSFAIPAALFGLGVLLVRSFLRRGSIFLAALSFPLYLATYEYLVAIASPHSTFGNLGYTQMNCLPVIQIASVTGIWGISFIVFLFATTVAVLSSGVGESAASSRACHHSRRDCVRSISFWRMAIAGKSVGRIGHRYVHWKRRADESLSGLGGTSAAIVSRIRR